MFGEVLFFYFAGRKEKTKKMCWKNKKQNKFLDKMKDKFIF